MREPKAVISGRRVEDERVRPYQALCGPCRSAGGWLAGHTGGWFAPHGPAAAVWGQIASFTLELFFHVHLI